MSAKPALARRRSESLHVDMGRLSEQSFTLHQQTQLPSRSSLLGLRLVNDDTVEQTSATNGLDQGRFEVGEFRSEDLA